MTLRRVFFVLLIHFVVLVCYPNYGAGGFGFGIMSAVIWSLGVIALGIIITLLAMERWDRMNTGITVAIVVLCAWFLLMRLPQEDKISPMKKIAYGNLPTVQNIKDGLKPFGFNWDKISGWITGARGGAEKLNDLEGRTDKLLKQAQGE